MPAAVPALRLPGPPLRPWAEEVAEVDVLEPALPAVPRRPFRARPSAAPAARPPPSKAAWPNWSYELPLLGVGEDVVGLLDFLELRLGRLVARVDVGVVLPRQAAIRLLDLLGRGVSGDAQDLVIIAVGHRRVVASLPWGGVYLRPARNRRADARLS